MRPILKTSLRTAAFMLVIGLLVWPAVLLLAGCSLALAPNRRLPPPPRRATIEQAQQYRARLLTPKYLNRRYRPIPR